MAEVVNVPDVDGVPQVNFAAVAQEGIELLDSDGALGLPSGSSQWGIFLNGAPVVQADSVIDFTLKKEWAVADYPVEQGSFGTYDKVQLPFDTRVRFAAGGSAANRQALLDSVEAIAGDYNLYDIVTPEAVYTSTNIVHFDFKRSARNGVGLIVVDVWLLQVRVIAGSTSGSTSTNPDSGTGTGDTAEPSGTDASNGGTVQATPATTTQTEAYAGTINQADPQNAAGFQATVGGIDSNYLGVADVAIGSAAPEDIAAAQAAINDPGLHVAP